MDERLPLASIILFDVEKKPKESYREQGERVSKEAMDVTRELVRQSKEVIGEARWEERKKEFFLSMHESQGTVPEMEE